MLSTCLCRGYTERNLKTIISCRNEPSIYSLRRKGRLESFAVPAGPLLCIMGFASVINTWGLLPPALSAGTCCSQFSGQPCGPQGAFTPGLKVGCSSALWQRHVEGAESRSRARERECAKRKHSGSVPKEIKTQVTELCWMNSFMA